jgi:hypothetical protein
MKTAESDTTTKGALIPYYMHSTWRDTKKCFDPYYFNKKKIVRSNIPNPEVQGDPFNMNTTSDPNKKIDPRYVSREPVL